MEHVPYKDISQVFVDMYAGQIQLYFPSVSPALTQMKSGKIRVLAPTGVPPKIIGQINAAMKKMSAGLDLQKRFTAIGADLTTTTPVEFSAFVKVEINKWAKVVKESGMRVD